MTFDTKIVFNYAAAYTLVHPGDNLMPLTSWLLIVWVSWHKLCVNNILSRWITIKFNRILFPAVQSCGTLLINMIAYHRLSYDIIGNTPHCAPVSLEPSWNTARRHATCRLQGELFAIDIIIQLYTVVCMHICSIKGQLWWIQHCVTQ